MSLNYEVSVAVRRARRARGLSLETFASRVELTATQLSEYERGMRGWTLEMLERASAALGVQPRDLLPTQDPDDARIAALEADNARLRRQAAAALLALSTASTGLRAALEGEEDGDAEERSS